MKHDEALPDQLASFLEQDGVVIFLFHGVIEKHSHPVRNYTGKHLEKKLFESCIRQLAHAGKALSMVQVLEHCRNQCPFPPQSYAITFDDGFENNLTIAAPILQKWQTPAMVYLTTSFIEENRMSWIDRIERAVEETLEKKIRLEGENLFFSLDTPKEKIVFLKAVRTYAKNNPACDPGKMADRICQELRDHGSDQSNDPLDQKLSWKQIREARKSGLLDFGGHSHTHKILSFLASDQLAQELDNSFALLRNRAEIGPEHYSYPEGLAHCFNGEVIDALQQRGVKCCPTAMAGVNRPSADPFRLCRILVA